MDDAEVLDGDGNPRDRNFPLDLRVYGWNWAQDLLVKHTPLQKIETVTIDTGGREVVLPDDFYAVELMSDSYEERWWTVMKKAPGLLKFPDEETLEYWLWGNRMFLESEKDVTSTDLTLYYWAYYPEVEFSVSNDVYTWTQEQILVPRWAESALCHLATAFCFQLSSIEAADINNWRIRVDSGNPLMNPRAQQAREHLFWWNAIMDSFPPARDSEMA